MIELAQNALQPRMSVMKTGWELKQKAPHPRAQQIGYKAKVPNQSFGPRETLDVCDELANFYGINKLAFPRLAYPGVDSGQSGPRVKWRVQLNGLEAFGIVRKPQIRRQLLWIEGSAPMPVEPA